MANQICLLLLCGSLLLVNVQSFAIDLPKGLLDSILSKNADATPEQAEQAQPVPQLNLMDVLGQLMPTEKPVEKEQNKIETTTRERTSRLIDLRNGTMKEERTELHTVSMPAAASPTPTPNLNVEVNVHVDGKLQHEIVTQERPAEPMKVLLFTALRKPGNDSSEDEQDTDAKNTDASTDTTTASGPTETTESTGDSASEEPAKEPIEVTLEDLKAKYPKLFQTPAEEQGSAANAENVASDSSESLAPATTASSTDAPTAEQAPAETTDKLPVNSVSDGSA